MASRLFAAEHRRALARRLVKYASVSVVSTLTSVTVLGVLVGVLSFPAMWANVVATAAGTVPSFELNRRWVWSQGGRRPTLGQLVPFCSLSLLGLVLSTLAVRLVSAATATDGRLEHTVAVELANVGVYGTLWLVQFVLCDRVLFRDRSSALSLGDRSCGEVVLADPATRGLSLARRAGAGVVVRDASCGDAVVAASSAEIAGRAGGGQLEGFDPIGHHVHHTASHFHPAPDHHGASRLGSAAVAGPYADRADHVDQPGLVLQRDEGDPPGSLGTLAVGDHAGHGDPAAVSQIPQRGCHGDAPAA